MGKNILAVSTSGIQSDTILIQPGTSSFCLDRYTRVHIHGVSLKTNGTAVITIKAGVDTILFHSITGAGEFHVEDVNLYSHKTVSPQNITISVSTNVTCVGHLEYSLEKMGGVVVKKSS